MFNFGLTKYFLLLMIATAGATGAVQTNVEQLERNRIHKEHFYDALNAKILEQNMEDEDGKKGFKRLLTKQEYEALILEKEEAKVKKGTKTPRQYYILANYEIFELAGVKKIIGKRKTPEDEVKFLVPFEDIFETILMCHQQVGHRGLVFFSFVVF